MEEENGRRSRSPRQRAAATRNRRPLLQPQLDEDNADVEEISTLGPEAAASASVPPPVSLRSWPSRAWQPRPLPLPLPRLLLDLRREEHTALDEDESGSTSTTSASLEPPTSPEPPTDTRTDAPASPEPDHGLRLPPPHTLGFCAGCRVRSDTCCMGCGRWTCPRLGCACKCEVGRRYWVKDFVAEARRLAPLQCLWPERLEPLWEERNNISDQVSDTNRIRWAQERNTLLAAGVGLAMMVDTPTGFPDPGTLATMPFPTVGRTIRCLRWATAVLRRRYVEMAQDQRDARPLSPPEVHSSSEPEEQPEPEEPEPEDMPPLVETAGPADTGPICID